MGVRHSPPVDQCSETRSPAGLAFHCRHQGAIFLPFWSDLPLGGAPSARATRASPQALPLSGVSLGRAPLAAQMVTSSLSPASIFLVVCVVISSLSCRFVSAALVASLIADSFPSVPLAAVLCFVCLSLVLVLYDLLIRAALTPPCACNVLRYSPLGLASRWEFITSSVLLPAMCYLPYK